MSSEPEDDQTWLQRVHDAAVEAEFQTGRREQTQRQAEQHVVVRILRIVGGFTLIGLGIAALVLPGPGWLMILIGLGLLPYAWAERTILLIRRKVPGVPDEGKVPLRTWLFIGTLLVIGVTISIVYGDDMTRWVSGLWGDPDKLIT